MEQLKQITPSDNIVNLCVEENLNKKFWKYQNHKEFNKAIKELPKFEAHVRKHEKLWNKHRSQFNALEREHIDRTYIQN